MQQNQERSDTRAVRFGVKEYNQLHENTLTIRVLVRAVLGLYVGVAMGAAWLFGYVVLGVLEK